MVADNHSQRQASLSETLLDTAAIHISDVPLAVAIKTADQRWAAPMGQPLPLQQHAAYGLAAIETGAVVRQLFITDTNQQPLAKAMVMDKWIAGFIGFSTIFRGPVWLAPNISTPNKATICKAISLDYPKWRWRFLSMQPECDKSSPEARALKGVGLKRVMTGFSTAWLDLTPDQDLLRKGFAGKWRNQLVKAEQLQASLQINIGGHKRRHFDWLLEREVAHQNIKGYQAMPVTWLDSWLRASQQTDAGVLSITIIENGLKIAGGLFLLHGNSATYHIGWTGNRGRAICVQNLLMWKAIIALKKRGIQFLDMGGMNSDTLAGIARFKLGTGASPIQLSGAWM